MILCCAYKPRGLTNARSGTRGRGADEMAAHTRPLRAALGCLSLLVIVLCQRIILIPMIRNQLIVILE
jgi:hypothetical protein